MGVGKRLDKALQQQQQSAAGDLLSESLAKQCPLNGEAGVGVFYVYHNQPIPVLKDLADRLVDTLGDAVVVLGSSINNKGHAVAKVSPSLLGSWGADRLIKALTTHTGGGGGGQPGSTGSIGNCTAGPDGTLNTAIGLQSNTPGNFDSTSGPFINNGGFSMGLLTVGHANLPSNTLGNNLRGEQNKMFFGQGSTRGNPRGGFFGKGMHGAILIYENTGS